MIRERGSLDGIATRAIADRRAGLAGAARPQVARLRARASTMAHRVSTFAYGQPLVAKEKRYVDDEGVSVPGLIVPGGNVILFATDTRGSCANVAVRKALYHRTYPS